VTRTTTVIVGPFNYVLWDAPETPEEVQTRVQRAASAQQEHLARILEMYNDYAEHGLYGEVAR
jgi:hypothetical protein